MLGLVLSSASLEVATLPCRLVSSSTFVSIFANATSDSFRLILGIFGATYIAEATEAFWIVWVIRHFVLQSINCYELRTQIWIIAIFPVAHRHR